jgi:ATP-binding cassette, subfamily C, bacterial LapB
MFAKSTEIQEDRLEPVARMIKTLERAGVKAFEDPGAWEFCLCAAVLALEPRCKTYRLLEALPAGRGRYDECDVTNTLARLGYFSRRLHGAVKDIDARLLPSLYVDERDMPVLLIAEEPDGRLKIFRDEAISFISAQKLSGKGKFILFERFDESRPATSRFARAGSGYSWFRALLGRFKGSFAQILTAGLVINVISLTTPLMIMLVYNRVIATGTLDVLPMILVGMALAAGFEMILRGIRSKTLAWIAARLDNIVGNRIFAHLIGLSPALIERASVSSQIARIKTFESIRDFFCGSVFLSMIELPFVVLSALVIYAIAGPLVLVPLFMGGAYALLFFVIYKQVRRSIRLAAKASSARQQFSIETLEKLRAVRTYGLSSLWEEKFRDLSGKEMMAHFRLNFLGMAGEILGNALTILSGLLTISFGALMIWDGSLSTGALVATMILVWRVITPFYSVCSMVPRLEQLRNSILQVNTLIDIETERQESKSSAVLPSIRGQVDFANVRLRYNDDGEDIFHDLSFSARAGDLVAITGENGAGKSSLLKLVKALYKPSSGAVLIDGFDLRQLDSAALRKQIAYIPQQADFFEGSILENLRLCNPIASLEEIHLALDLACVREEIESLPQGLGTPINRYDAKALPSNIAVRLSLARLYLHTAPILLIDEIPNTLLSGKTGLNLRGYLARCKGKRTCLMVTYREDFLKMADTLIYLRRQSAPLIGAPEKIMSATMEAA